ncbi:hypothetical protein BGZ50_005520 [Haplosporangium sp. Z 11]|nr:hypothetical protein BGZ50_005520 [Haplosporangium sp. Z 11]
MIDLKDPYTQGLFSKQDWAEIMSDLPDPVLYGSSTLAYMDTFKAVDTIEDLKVRLKDRPDGVELELVHMCLVNCNLSESWWMSQAWGICSQLSKGVPGSFILTGDITGLNSTIRRNNKERQTNAIPHAMRKKMGVRADLIWRTMAVPEKDWGIGETVRAWEDLGQKYTHESTFKLPRQLHDVLTARTVEVGGPSIMRDVLVSGLIIGGKTPMPMHPADRVVLGHQGK